MTTDYTAALEAAPTPPIPATETAPASHRLDVRFTGSGSEYFRIWIVNLLLSIVTAGLYTPWARRRTARYFYDHTIVADSPLEFTAPLRLNTTSFVTLE